VTKKFKLILVSALIGVLGGFVFFSSPKKYTKQAPSKSLASKKQPVNSNTDRVGNVAESKAEEVPAEYKLVKVDYALYFENGVPGDTGEYVNPNKLSKARRFDLNPKSDPNDDLHLDIPEELKFVSNEINSLHRRIESFEHMSEESSRHVQLVLINGIQNQDSAENIQKRLVAISPSVNEPEFQAKLEKLVKKFESGS